MVHHLTPERFLRQTNFHEFKQGSGARGKSKIQWGDAQDSPCPKPQDVRNAAGKFSRVMSDEDEAGIGLGHSPIDGRQKAPTLLGV